jgi:hypothetical protein
MKVFTSPELVPKAEIVKRVGILAAAYPNAKISKETLKIYVGMLSDLSLEVLDCAIQKCLAESEFFPTIAKIRSAASSLTSVTNCLPSSWEAWNEVTLQIRHNGYYRTPQFSNGLVARAVNALGWSQLCLSENQIADRAHFVRVYEQLVASEMKKEMLLKTPSHLRHLQVTVATDFELERNKSVN